jgi:hypothetical protein
MLEHMGGEVYELTIVAQPDTAPPIIRLRRVLKALLRVHRFRCTSCRDVTPKLPAAVTSNETKVGVPDPRGE